jgi:tetratricopeptide (TPR) repeat protein
LSLLAGFATALHQARRAERRFQQVRQLAHELLFDLHGDIAKLPGATVARERLVTTALRYLDELAREAGSDMSLLQELAAAYEKVGDVQGRAQGPNRGQPQAARSSYAKGLALVEEVAAEGGSGRGLSGLRGRLQLKLAVLDREAGDTTAAHAGLLQSLAAIAELEGLAGLTDEDFALIGDIYSTAGDFALRRDGAEALRHYEGALRTAERWAREHPGDRAQHSRSLAEARRADALAKRGDLEACLAGYRRAITLREELVRRDPMNVHWRRELKVLYNWLGNFLGGREFINAGDRRAALDHYRRGLAMSEELAAADPEDARGRLDLAIGYWKVGGLLIETSPREARTLLSRSLAIVERLRQGAPESFELRRREATFRFALAEATWGDGDRPAALAMLRGTVREGVVLLDQDPADGDVRALLLSSRRRLGEMLLAEGAGDEARRLLEGSEEQARRWSEESPHDLHARWTFAESLGSLAYYHRARAAKTSRSADQRRADEKTACTLLLRRLDLWTSWPKVAVSSVFDQSRRREAERAVASCGSKDA